MDYGIVKVIDAADFNRDGLIIPSVLGYMEQNRGLSFSSSYKLSGLLGIGMAVSTFHFSQWNGTEFTNIYESAKMNLTSIKPGIFAMSPYHETGIFNRLRLDITFGPAVEFTNLDPGKSFPWLDSYSGNPTPGEIKDNAFGLFSGLSIRFAVIQLVDLHLYYRIEKYWGSNSLISSNGIFLHSYGFGIGFQFLTDKYYLYE